MTKAGIVLSDEIYAAMVRVIDAVKALRGEKYGSFKEKELFDALTALEILEG